MAKTVLTYSWLVRKAMAMFRKDKDEYIHMVQGAGTDKMLRGVRVKWEGYNSTIYQGFSLRDPASGRKHATLYCNYRDGKAYTFYEMNFTTTGYRKRFVDKYMPITLPEGVRSRHNTAGRYTPCIIHHADGSVHSQARWQGGGRNRAGSVENTALVICDDTGKFVDDRIMVAERNLCGPYEEARRVFGWFDAASRNRTEWLESIKAMPEGTCDHKKMLAVAARAYLAAHKMVSKYPHLRMALFPAVKWDEGSLDFRIARFRFGDEHTTGVVVARDAANNPTLFFMPAVLVYWIEPGLTENNVVRLSMTIPPHGNPLMDPTGGPALSSKTVRESRDGKRSWDRVPIPGALERPYNALRAWRADSVGDSMGRHYEYTAFDPSFNGPMGEQDKKLVLWHKSENKVLAEVSCSQTNEIETPLPMDTPIGMKPEDVAARFEEKLLLASLPLC
jgi:hypothetical protein